MRFRGLAGVAMLLTVVVVASGVVGRYIYTAIPRAVDGSELPEGSPPDAEKRAERLAAMRRALATWYSVHVPLTWVLFAAALVHAIVALYYATLQR